MSLKPLVFLTVRSFINGVKRAVTSPRRLIGMSVLLFYWFRFLTPAFQGPRGRGFDFASMPRTSMPPIEAIDAVVFALFAFPSFFLMVGALTPKGGFRPADVEVLFPTPINPKVLLVFRIVRDALLTLLIPLFFAVFARPMTLPVETFVRDYPAQGQLLGKAVLVAWILMSLGWTTIGYALSLFVNRSDERSDRNKKIIDRALWVFFGALILFIGLRLRAELSWDSARLLAQHPFLRFAFFPASLATLATMSTLTGSLVYAICGFGGLVLVIAAGLAVAMTQVDYLYDQAAAKGFDSANMRNLQRSGDVYGVIAEQARKGKIKNGRLSRKIGGLHVRGGAALLWKELLLQTRGAMWQYFAFAPVVLGMILLPVWGNRTNSLMAEKALLLTFLGMAVLVLSMQTATSGFIELLKRVDFLKPLPFTSTVTVFWEVVPKAIPTFIVCGIACLGVVVVDPRVWDVAIGSIFMAPSLSVVLTAVVLMVTVLFPDVDDVTQRNFRGIMMMLGCVIAASPMLAVVGVLTYLGLNGLVVAIPAVALNLGVALGVSSIAGGLYAGFNPNE